MLTDALAKLNGGKEPDLVAPRSGRQRAKFAQMELASSNYAVSAISYPTAPKPRPAGEDSRSEFWSRSRLRQLIPRPLGFL